MTRTLSLALLFAPLILGAPTTRAAEEYTDAFPADLVRLLMDFGGQGDFAVYNGLESRSHRSGSLCSAAERR